MKTIVAKLINLVNNNKLFCLGLLVASVALGVLYWYFNEATTSDAAGTAVAFTGVIICIRFLFSYCLPRIKEEYWNDPWGRKVLSSLMWGFIIFLHGPIVAIFKDFITNDTLYDVVNTFNMWIGYAAFGVIGFAFLVVLLYGLGNLWQGLVRWANK